MASDPPKGPKQYSKFAKVLIDNVVISKGPRAEEIVNEITVEFPEPIAVGPATAEGTKCITKMTLDFTNTPASADAVSVDIKDIMTVEAMVAAMEEPLNALTVELPAPVPVACGTDPTLLGIIREITLCFPEADPTEVTGKAAVTKAPSYAEFNELVKQLRRLLGQAVPPVIIDPPLSWTGKK